MIPFSFLFLFFSFLLIFISLIIKKRAVSVKKKHLIQNGKIRYSDLYHPQKALHSKSLPLSGKPDYIISNKKNEYIPVEVKTGYHLKPKKPHIMQLISYCHLVQETYGKMVPYGILVYYDTKLQFKIPFSDEYHSILSSTIDRMYDHMSQNIVSCNHNNVDKCLNCSMKESCPEKLQ